LLERYNAANGRSATRGWVYVEGTPYDFGDLHNDIWEDKDGAFSDWVKVARAAQEDFPTGKILWPERFPAAELANIRKEMGEWMFSAQYLMKCIPEGDGLCDTKDVIFIPQEVISNILPTLRLHVTIDTSNMDPMKRGDYTVLTVGGFDRDGRLYIVDCRCGRFSPEAVVDMIFYFQKQYPHIIDYKMEADVHACMILPHLQRETSKRAVYPIVTPIKRDTQVSKQTRIKGLRPWFKQGIIRFNANLSLQVRQELLSEIAKFPSQSSGVHDDILDTLADLMQDGEGGVTLDVIADSPDMKFNQFGRQRPQNKFLGFAEEGVAKWLYGNEEANSVLRSQMTGVL
jgi:predicted phage terminase large subunit-like protein